MHGATETGAREGSSSSAGTGTGSGRADDEEDETDDDEHKWRKPRRHAAFDQKVQDPYASDDPGSMLLPVVVAVGAFIPLLFCLCRL